MVERTIRPIALNRKNALFAGHETGAQNWAILASIIETCKLNSIEPHGYITSVLERNQPNWIQEFITAPEAAFAQHNAFGRGDECD